MFDSIVYTVKEVDEGDLMLQDREKGDVVVDDGIGDLEDDLTDELVGLGC